MPVFETAHTSTSLESILSSRYGEGGSVSQKRIQEQFETGAVSPDVEIMQMIEELIDSELYLPPALEGRLIEVFAKGQLDKEVLTFLAITLSNLVQVFGQDVLYELTCEDITDEGTLNGKTYRKLQLENTLPGILQVGEQTFDVPTGVERINVSFKTVLELYQYLNGESHILCVVKPNPYGQGTLISLPEIDSSSSVDPMRYVNQIDLGIKQRKVREDIFFFGQVLLGKVELLYNYITSVTSFDIQKDVKTVLTQLFNPENSLDNWEDFDIDVLGEYLYPLLRIAHNGQHELVSAQHILVNPPQDVQQFIEVAPVIRSTSTLLKDQFVLIPIEELRQLRNSLLNEDCSPSILLPRLHFVKGVQRSPVYLSKWLAYIDELSGELSNPVASSVVY